MTTDDLEYLKRALRRERFGAFERVGPRHQAMAAQHSANGRYQSGVTLVASSKLRQEILEDAARRMAKVAFDTCGATEGSADALQNELRALRRSLSDNLADFFRKANWIDENQRAALGNDFEMRTEAYVDAVLDDFRHKMLDGARLGNDVLASVMVMNSPGAIVQAGAGNSQAFASADFVKELRSALQPLGKLQAASSLSIGDRQALGDVIEVIDNELSKQRPDELKVRRWGVRLLQIGEKVGVAVATEALKKALFG